MKRILRRAGVLVSRYDPIRDPEMVRMRFFQTLEINVVFDVGANTGQFASALRADGYRGRIISFEPLSSAFRALQARSSDDPNWLVEQCALGESHGTAEINISGNSYSSSLLPMLPRLREAAPESAYVATEQIRITPLDTLFSRYCAPRDKAFLKIDTQGYTNSVLRGARSSLPHISGLQVELSLVPLYENEPLIGEVVSKLEQEGFRLVLVKPEFTDNTTGQQLQVDGVFFRL